MSFCIKNELRIEVEWQVLVILIYCCIFCVISLTLNLLSYYLRVPSCKVFKFLTVGVIGLKLLCVNIRRAKSYLKLPTLCK